MRLILMRFTIGLVTLFLLIHNPAHAAERIGIFVGANRGTEGDPTLKFAVHDAEKLRDVLVELGGFSRTKSVLLADPTAQDIRRVFSSIRYGIQSNRREDTVLVFYYSGHADDKGFKLGREHFGYGELKSMLERTGAKIKITILDSCRSGAITRSKGVSRGQEFAIELDQRLSAHGEIFIASSHADELSQESDLLGGSFFTHYLVSGLRGNADRTGDAIITLGEAYSYAYHQTVRQTANTRIGSQHPVFEFNIAGEGDVVLTNLTGPQAALNFPRGVRGEFLVWDQDSHSVVGEIHLGKDQSSRSIALRPGSYVVKQRQDNHVRLAEIRLRPGEQKTIDLHAMKRVEFMDDYTAKSGGYFFPLTLGGTFGYQNFYNPKGANKLLAPAFYGGAYLFLDRFPLSYLNLSLDLSITQYDVNFRIDERAAETEMTAVQFGLALPFVYRWRGWKAWAGPRFGGTAMIRIPKGMSSEVAAEQRVVVFTPGLVIGGGYTFFSKLVLEARFRSSYSTFKVDKERRHLVTYEALVVLGWRFNLQARI